MEEVRLLKNTAYKSHRRFLNLSIGLFVFSILFSVQFLIGISYPHYIISSFGIIIILFLIIKKFGLISIPALLSGILFAPCLTPLYSHGLFKAVYYSWNNRLLQEDVYLVNKTCFIIFLSSIVYCAVLLFCKNDTNLNVDEHKKAEFIFGKNIFMICCFLFLFFCWLTDPGPILLFTDYTTMLRARYEGTQYAGAFVVIFWSLAFMTYRNYEGDFLRRFFEVSTCIGLLWLLLHARRSELLGIILVCLLYMAEKRVSKKVLVYGIMLLFALVLIGNIRSTAILTQSLGDIVNASSLSRNTESGRVAALPGGASNIFVTMLDSVHLIDDLNYGLLYGKTYFDYIYNMIPLNLINFLDFRQPSYFWQVLAGNFQYNGGTYIFAPAYANFNILGVLVMGGFLGKLVFFAHTNFRSNRFLLQGISLMIVALFVRGMWYDPITIMKPILVFMALFLIWYFYPNKTTNRRRI